MLNKVEKLINQLNTDGLRYCHWKSNMALAEALAGQTDIDLLIHRRDATLFRTILSQLGFRPAVAQDGDSFLSVEHFFALDEGSGVLVHVHAYFRVITGESLVKNYRLPIEEMLLQNTREVDSVRVPTKSAELVVFTVRMMMKHTSVVELALLARDWRQVQQEAAWLLDSDPIDETLGLVKCWLPWLDVELFSDCIAALNNRTSLARRIVLAHRLRSRLRSYARHSALAAWVGGIKKFTKMGFRRLTHAPKGLAPVSGGAVIAFVGPEATGKSTLIAETNRWLGEHFAVEQIHAGKPEATALSIVPNLFLPALRSLLPAYRSGHVETQYAPAQHPEKQRESYPLIFAIRSALLAHDRRALLTRAFGQAANGLIVLCDRYPSLQSGAPDSPQLAHLPVTSDRLSLRRRLTSLESRLYREIPPPDLVILLSVPVEIALARNASRGKTEPEDYVRFRHAHSSSVAFGNTPVHRINTDQPLEMTILEVKKAIWNDLQ